MPGPGQEVVVLDDGLAVAPGASESASIENDNITQTIPGSETQTVVEYDTKDHETTEGMVDLADNSIIIPQRGVYLVIGQCRVDIPEDIEDKFDHDVLVQADGNTAAWGEHHVRGNEETATRAARPLQLDEGSVVKCLTQQNSGQDVTTLPDPYQTYLAVTLMVPL